MCVCFRRVELIMVPPHNSHNYNTASTTSQAGAFESHGTFVVHNPGVDPVEDRLRIVSSTSRIRLDTRGVLDCLVTFEVGRDGLDSPEEVVVEQHNAVGNGTMVNTTRVKGLGKGFFSP